MGVVAIPTASTPTTATTTTPPPSLPHSAPSTTTATTTTTPQQQRQQRRRGRRSCTLARGRWPVPTPAPPPPTPPTPPKTTTTRRHRRSGGILRILRRMTATTTATITMAVLVWLQPARQCCCFRPVRASRVMRSAATAALAGRETRQGGGTTAAGEERTGRGVVAVAAAACPTTAFIRGGGRPRRRLSPHSYPNALLAPWPSAAAAAAASTRLYSTGSGNSSHQRNDQSAATKSRAAFRMPTQSLDDSRPAEASSSSSSSSSSSAVAVPWGQLGLRAELVACLETELGLPGPTVVQQLVLPVLLQLGHGGKGSSSKGVAAAAAAAAPGVPGRDPPPPHHQQQHVAFLAATGSGKTLAYCLPVMQLLKQQEERMMSGLHRVDVVGGGGGGAGGDNDAITTPPTTAARPRRGAATGAAVAMRAKQRPRAIILAPTRELCLQITKVCKQLSHSIKLSVAAVTGGGSDGGGGLGAQRRLLEARPVDVLVATPGRLLKHVQAGSIVLSSRHLQYVVLDEMDTMLEQGFAADLQQLLYPVLYHQRPAVSTKTAVLQSIDPNRDLVATAPSIILTSATMTQAIQKMVGDTNSNNNSKDDDGLINAKRHYTKPPEALAALGKGGHNGKLSLQQQQQPPPLKAPLMVLPGMMVIKAPGLHKTVPRLRQVFVDTAAVDKLSLLIDVLSNQDRKQADSLTMVFCNTAASCRAVEFALAEARVEAVLSYHGELNSAARSANLARFRDGTARVLVCTDLAARGLDIPSVDHVVMFDFPLNALDYLHRSGRTARGLTVSHRQGNGKVTALVAKRDKVLANAIQQAVQRGEPIDGLSSRKTDYLPGGRLGTSSSSARSSTSSRRYGGTAVGASSSSSGNKRSGSRISGGSSSSPFVKPKNSAKFKPKDTTMRKRRAGGRG